MFSVGFKVGMIGLDYCVQETYNAGMCRNVVRRVGEGYSVVCSDYGLTPVPDYAVAMTSIKLMVDGEYDRYHQVPDPEVDECVKDVSCLNGGKVEGTMGMISRKRTGIATCQLYLDIGNIQVKVQKKLISSMPIS